MFPSDSPITRTFVDDGALGVEWLWNEPPMERAVHFRLLLPSGSTEFIGHYEYGTDLLKAERPDLSWEEVFDLAQGDRVIQYRAMDIRGEFDRDRFVETWHKLLVQAAPTSRVRIVYTEGGPASGTPRRAWTKMETGPVISS